MEQKLVGYSKHILESNQEFKLALHVSTSDELAEKLALRTAKEALDNARVNAEINAQESIKEIDKGVKTGDWDRVVCAAEQIHKRVNPDSKLPLVGVVFNTMVQTKR